MKVAVKKITSNGFNFKHKILADDWNLNGFDVKFIGQIKLKGILKRKNGQIISRVCITAYRQISCSRCCLEVCQVKEYNFHKSYQLENLGVFLNIGRDSREEMLLNFPLRVLCTPGCRGLCPLCGKNLNWGDCRCIKGGK